MYMQNTSVLVFFVLIHVPLTKVSAIWTFLTGFTVWFLDSKTKATIYHGMKFLTRLFVDPQAAYKQWVKSRKYDSLLDTGRNAIANDKYSKRDRSAIKAIADWVCVHVIVFTAIISNYLYTTFLHDMTLTVTQYSI